ncbi:MAG: hypothetical protein FWH07_02290 [Oscillospiraceae bacterium]|nr:hypothetical protein [Oscillospiraceae bacterium]
MKKILATLLVLAMTLSLAACTQESARDDSDSPPTPIEADTPVEISATMDGTRALAIFELINGDEFVMDADMMGAKMLMSRKGDELFVDVDMLGVIKTSILVADGKMYLFNGGDMTYAVRDSNQEQLDKIFQLFDSFAEALSQLERASLIEMGTEVFDYTGDDLYYEELAVEGSAVTRYYFDGDDLIGTKMVEVGYSMPFFVSAEVPEDAFDIPEGYTLDESGDFNALFEEALGY